MVSKKKRVERAAKQKARSDRLSRAKEVGVSVGSGAFARKGGYVQSGQRTNTGSSNSSSSRALDSGVGSLAVTLPTEAGGTQTVTKAGQVTIRDSNSRLVKRYQTSVVGAKSFITKGAKDIESFRQTQNRAKTTLNNSLLVSEAKPSFVNVGESIIKTKTSEAKPSFVRQAKTIISKPKTLSTIKPTKNMFNRFQNKVSKLTFGEPAKIEKTISSFESKGGFARGVVGGAAREVIFKPVKTGAIILASGGASYVLKQLVAVTAVSKFAPVVSKGVKLVGRGLGAAFVGSKAVQVTGADGSVAKGRVVGQALTELTAFRVGGVLGSKIPVKVPEPKIVLSGSKVLTDRLTKSVGSVEASKVDGFFSVNGKVKGLFEGLSVGRVTGKPSKLLFKSEAAITIKPKFSKAVVAKVTARGTGQVKGDTSSVLALQKIKVGKETIREATFIKSVRDEIGGLDFYRSKGSVFSFKSGETSFVDGKLKGFSLSKSQEVIRDFSVPEVKFQKFIGASANMGGKVPKAAFKAVVKPVVGVAPSSLALKQVVVSKPLTGEVLVKQAVKSVLKQEFTRGVLGGLKSVSVKAVPIIKKSVSSVKVVDKVVVKPVLSQLSVVKSKVESKVKVKSLVVPVLSQLPVVKSKVESKVKVKSVSKVKSKSLTKQLPAVKSKVESKLVAKSKVDLLSKQKTSLRNQFILSPPPFIPKPILPSIPSIPSFKFKAKVFKPKKVSSSKLKYVFTPTIVRPSKIDERLRLFTGVELR